MSKREIALRVPAILAAALLGSGCITSTVMDARTGNTGIAENESIVIMAKSYHLGNETERKYIRCIEDKLGRGRDGLNVIPHDQFVDSLFPWFEPRTAPAETKNLAKLMERPGVAEKIAEQGVRYIVWLDGDTERVAGGGHPVDHGGPGSPAHPGRGRRRDRGRDLCTRPAGRLPATQLGRVVERPVQFQEGFRQGLVQLVHLCFR